MEEDEDADLEAQLMLMGGNAGKNQTLEKPAATKRIAEVENRQKIFEDEIIKRIKEIQRYTKSIHLQVKKQGQQQTQLEDDFAKLERKELKES